MFTCQAIKNGASYLSKHLSANDYYSAKETVLGRWIGKGAERLNLAGKEIGSKDAAFEALRNNLHPETGESLTGNTKAERRAFYDFQCSAPKSVSIMAVTFGDSRLVDAHKEAVRVALAELERYAGRQDNHRNKDGSWTRETVTTGNVVAAEFTHDASRELDAQLHTHLVCANATFDEKTGKWHALENGDMYRSIALAGRIYQSEMAQRVQALGYSIVEDREKGVVQGFEIAGVTEQDRAIQSTRRAQIDAEIAKFKDENEGRKPTPGQIHVMATDTRGKKLSEITTEEVREKQLAKHSETDQQRLQKIVSDARSGIVPVRAAGSSAREIIEYAVEHLLERKAVVTRKDVMTFALQESLGSATVTQLRKALEQSPLVISLAPQADKPAEFGRITTVAQLERENESGRIIAETAGKFAPMERGAELSAGLGDDQKAAVKEILNTRDGVHALIGRAGAGKTHTLTEIARVTRLAGIIPVYAAPTHAAKEVLQEEKFENAETVSQLLIQIKRGDLSLRGRLLVVDEAGMLSTKQGTELLQAAEKAGARVLLVGDEKQLTSVEAGDWLGALMRNARLNSSVLTDIRRQKPAEYRSAMMDMSQGKVKNGLEKLDKQGWVHENKEKYLSTAAQAWLKAKENAILVAPTWREIDKLNEVVRNDLRENGTLTGQETMRAVMDSTDFTAAQRKVTKNYTPGLFLTSAQRVPGLRKGEWTEIQAVDRKSGNVILATGAKIDVRKNGASLQVARAISIGIQTGDTLMLQGNDKTLGIINGERVTVIGPVADGGLRVRQERGKKQGREVVLPKTYQTFVHGYAVTAEKSQGATVDHCIVAAERLDGRRTYVATSRGRRTIELHVPDKTKLFDKAENTIKPLEAALDFKPGPGRNQNSRHHQPGRTSNRILAYLQQQRTKWVKAAQIRIGRFVGRGRDAKQNSNEHER